MARFLSGREGLAGLGSTGQCGTAVAGGHGPSERMLRRRPERENGPNFSIPAPVVTIGTFPPLFLLPVPPRCPHDAHLAALSSVLNCIACRGRRLAAVSRRQLV